VDITIDDIELHDLAAVVVSRQVQENDTWGCGVRFCLEEPGMKKDEICRNLLLIEEKLKSSSNYPCHTAV